jgi:large subunit ribosomal protein L24
MGMLKSSKPKKQLKFRHNAPLHLKQHFVHVHLDKVAKEKYNLKNRAIQVSKGDTVKVMVGSHKNITGKVNMVSLKNQVVYIDSLKRKNSRGKESGIPIKANNLSIIDLNLTDKYRANKYKLKQVVEPKVTKEQKKEVDSKKEEIPKNKEKVKDTDVKGNKPEVVDTVEEVTE